MNTTILFSLLFIIALFAANAPFLSNRYFLCVSPASGEKSPWWRLLEWLVLYGLVMVLAMGMERQFNGSIHSQSWEFWPTTLVVFSMLAIPGFIWRYDLKHYLLRYQKQKKQFDQSKL